MLRHVQKLFAPLIAALLAVNALADEPLVRESRPVANISAVSLKGSGDVVITQGSKEELVVEAEKSVLPKISTEVDNGTLSLSMKSGTFHFGKNPKIIYHLTIKQLNKIALAGSGDIRAASLNADKLDIVTSGSGDVRIDSLSAQEINVRISGSSGVKLAGKVNSQSIKIAGSGDYGSPELRSGAASIAIAGSGDATLWATDALSISIAGSGDVKYYGQPKVSQSVAGSGAVQGLGAK